MRLGRVVLVMTILTTVALSSHARASGLESTYVALGDSYTSGAGLSPYLTGSTTCSRSPEAYPEDVARALAGPQLDFVACSGATISQIMRQVHSASASLANASLVTLTAGGNDLSFSKLSLSCLGAVTSPSSDHVQYLPFSGGSSACANAVAGAARLLGASVNPKTGAVSSPAAVTANVVSTPSPLEGRLITLLQTVLQASTSGNARAGANVLVVEYPMLLTHFTSHACLLSGSPLEIPGGVTLYPAFSSLVTRELIGVNSLLRRETAAVVRTLASAQPRLQLVDTSSFVPLNCRTGDSSDLNGVSVSTLRSGSTLHPTERGQALMATAVLRLVG